MLPCLPTMEGQDDDVLWARFDAGDEEAWHELCVQHWRAIRRFFVNKVGDQADDLTQSTFRRLQEARGRFERRSTLRAFVFGIARNVLLEFVRQRRRDARVEFGDVSAAVLDTGPSSLLCRRAEQRLVLEGLRNLTLDHQIVLELFYWEEMPDSEIAAVLEINVNTIRGRLLRARARLKELVEGLEKAGPLPSTSADLERWALSVRARLDGDAAPA